MKMIKSLTSVLLSALIMLGCNKELPQIPNSETPVFYAKGTIDGQTIEIDAGENQYWMESASWVWNGVEVYRGELKNNENSFLIDLFNGNILAGSTYDELIQMNHFACAFLTNYSLGNISLSQLTGSSNIDEASWEMSGDQNNPLNFQAPGVYELKLNIYSPLVVSVVNQIIIGYNNPNLFKLSASFQNQLVYASIGQNSVGIESIDWIYGDQTTTTTAPYATFIEESGCKELVAKVKFSNGVVRKRTILTGQNGYPYVEDYAYIIESTNSHLFDYKTELRIRLGEETYTSLQAPQTLDYPIQIKEKSTYVDPITKQQALKLKLEMNVKMKKLSSEEIVDAHFETTIGLPFVN